MNFMANVDMQIATPQEPEQLDRVRKVIADRLEERRMAYKTLSRAIGMNGAYMHQFMKRGTPKTLPEDVRDRIAAELDLPSDVLRHDEPRRVKATPEARSDHTPVIPAGRRSVPVYRQGDAVDPRHATEWTEWPSFANMSSHAFALWVVESTGRLRTADLLYVQAGRPAKTGDIVVVIQDGKARWAGELSTDGAAQFVNGPKKMSITPDATVLRVVGILLP
jgi:SOS-response transcriptional repressor LexA